MKARALRLGSTIVLSAAEAATLRDELPPNWAPPEPYLALEEDRDIEPFDAYHLFDITIRDLLDEACGYDVDTSRRGYRLLGAALGRIVDAHPNMISDVLGPADPLAQAIGPAAAGMAAIVISAERLSSHAGLSEERIAAVMAAPGEWAGGEGAGADGPENALAHLLTARALTLDAVSRALADAGESDEAGEEPGDGTDISWGGMQDLRVFYAIHRERIVGILYWGDPVPGRSVKGEPVIAEAGWYLIHGDNPGEHFSVEATPIDQGMDEQAIRDATFEALERGEREILDHLGLNGGG